MGLPKPPPLPWEEVSGYPGFRAGEGQQADRTDADTGPAELYWIPVSSSNVNAISWNEGADFKLWVRFHSGAVYKYDVDEDVYDEMFSASSQGRFVWHVLRMGHFPYERVY